MKKILLMIFFSTSAIQFKIEAVDFLSLISGCYKQQDEFVFIDEQHQEALAKLEQLKNQKKPEDLSLYEERGDYFYQYANEFLEISEKFTDNKFKSEPLLLAQKYSHQAASLFIDAFDMETEETKKGDLILKAKNAMETADKHNIWYRQTAGINRIPKERLLICTEIRNRDISKRAITI